MALLSPIIGREPKSSIRFLKVGFPGTAFSLVYGGAGSVHCLSSLPSHSQNLEGSLIFGWDWLGLTLSGYLVPCISTAFHVMHTLLTLDCTPVPCCSALLRSSVIIKLGKLTQMHDYHINELPGFCPDCSLITHSTSQSDSPETAKEQQTSFWQRSGDKLEVATSGNKYVGGA